MWRVVDPGVRALGAGVCEEERDGAAAGGELGGGFEGPEECVFGVFFFYHLD